MSSDISISFNCTPEQIRAAHQKAFGIQVTVPTVGHADVVKGLVNTLLGAIDSKVADLEKTEVHPPGGAWNKRSGSWGITIVADDFKKQEGPVGRLLAEEVARLQNILGVLPEK